MTVLQAALPAISKVPNTVYSVVNILRIFFPVE